MNIIDHASFSALIDDIWSTALSLNTQQTQAANIFDNMPSYCGVVGIIGDWNGGVLVQTTEKHARDLASIIFEKKPNEVGLAELDDIVGELANMLGGNVKAMLAVPCKLSLPTVTKQAAGEFNLPKEDILLSAVIEAQGEPIKIIFFKTTKKEGV